MGSEDQKNVVGLFFFLLNIFSSVLIIIVNKQLMNKTGYGFHYATTLCGLHYLTTFLTSKLTSWALSNENDQKKPPPKIPLTDVAVYTLFSDLSIVGLNLSLLFNTVGFYQITKLAIIPVSCAIEFLLLQKIFNNRIISSIGVVLLGVGLSTVSEVSLNGIGSVVAAIACVSTATQQVLIGHLQRKHSIGSNELIQVTSPIQAVSLLVLGPFVDEVLVGDFPWSYEFHVPSMVFLLGSCLLAAMVNISQFFVIGRFSAVTFQVVGHVKTVVVLFFGWFLFNDVITWKSFFGMCLAVVGMVMYGLFTVSDPPKYKTPIADIAVVKIASESKSGGAAAAAAVENKA